MLQHAGVDRRQRLRCTALRPTHRAGESPGGISPPGAGRTVRRISPVHTPPIIQPSASFDRLREARAAPRGRALDRRDTQDDATPLRHRDTRTSSLVPVELRPCASHRESHPWGSAPCISPLHIKKGPLRPREKGPPVGSVSTSTLLRHSETAHPAPPAGEPAVPDPNPEPAVPVRCGVRSSVARRVPGTLWTVGTHASRPGRKAHNCHPSRGAGGVSPEGP